MYNVKSSLLDIGYIKPKNALNTLSLFLLSCRCFLYRLHVSGSGIFPSVTPSVLSDCEHSLCHFGLHLRWPFLAVITYQSLSRVVWSLISCSTHDHCSECAENREFGIQAEVCPKVSGGWRAGRGGGAPGRLQKGARVSRPWEEGFHSAV